MEPESLGVPSSSRVRVGVGDGGGTVEIMLLHTELPPSPLFAREKWAEKLFFLLAPSSSQSILCAKVEKLVVRGRSGSFPTRPAEMEEGGFLIISFSADFAAVRTTWILLAVLTFYADST